MTRENFKDYSLEVILTVLKISSSQLDKMREIGDLSGEEIIQEKVIIPYERIYGALSVMDMEKITEEEFKSFEEIVEEIREKNGLSLEAVFNSQKKRKENFEKSGAQVVERFYKYNLNRMLDKREKIVEVYNKLASEEEKLENLLKDTIQEVEQFDIIYKLQPIREKLREIEKKYITVESDVKMLKDKLNSKWPSEIYGVISEDELLETYKDTFKMEE